MGKGRKRGQERGRDRDGEGDGDGHGDRDQIGKKIIILKDVSIRAASGTPPIFLPARPAPSDF